MSVYCFVWGVLIASVEGMAFDVGPHNFHAARVDQELRSCLHTSLNHVLRALHVDLMDGLRTGSPKHVHQPSCVDDHVGSSHSCCHLMGLSHIPLDGSHPHRACLQLFQPGT